MLEFHETCLRCKYQLNKITTTRKENNVTTKTISSQNFETLASTLYAN